MKIPVLKAALHNGDIISAGDLDWITIKQRDLQPDYIVNAEKIVGMTPRRMVVSGKPVRTQDLTEPQLVDRGDDVTLVYEMGAISLTAKGRALRSGARGDVIRVVNVDSNKSIEGVVQDQGVVHVIR